MLLGAAAGDAAAAAPNLAPPPSAVAVGSGPGGRPSFRIEGRTLTVTWPKALRRRGAGAVKVTAVCGEAIELAWMAPVPRQSLAGAPLMAPERGAGALPGGTRSVRLTLAADVAARAGWCGAIWTWRGRHRVWARMTLRRGHRPGCAPTTDRTLANDIAVVEQVGLGLGDDYGGSSLLRGCATPSGRWMALSTGEHTKGFGYGPVDVKLVGRWAGWIEASNTTGGPGGSCTLWRSDVASGGPAQQLALEPGDPSVRRCPSVIGQSATRYVLGAGGTVAWVTRVDGRLDRVNAAGYAGRTITLATVPAGATVATLAISPDGRTVTWTENGTPRSAVMP